MNAIFNQTLKLVISDKKYSVSKHTVIIKIVSDHEQKIIHDMKNFSLIKIEQIIKIMNNHHKIFKTSYIQSKNCRLRRYFIDFREHCMQTIARVRIFSHWVVKIPLIFCAR